MNSAARSFFVAVFFILNAFNLAAQSIGSFSSVEPVAQDQTLVIPSSHRFQRIIKTNDPLSLGGMLDGNLDYCGYVPIGGSSTQGYLSINSEIVNGAECAILQLHFDPGSKTWITDNGGKVDFPQSDLGIVSTFCSGTVTPDAKVLICEEDDGTGDDNSDGYEDRGWIIEIDPATRTVVNQDGIGGPDKLWAMGRQRHENVIVKNSGAVAYWGADQTSTGFIYKFVPTIPGDYSDGQLFVLSTTSSLGTGTWVSVPNTTATERNNTISVGGYNFNRVECLAAGPDDKIYFAATTSGRIYRFDDDGTTVSNLEVFVEPVNFDVDGSGPFAPTPWGDGADNLAFDGEGNLWVLQDGGDNYIWVVGPTHSASSPDVRLFGIVPAGSEPTGISFTPDYKYLFMSVQHPSSLNSQTQEDAAGQSVSFGTHTVLVIARAENLGNAALPVNFNSFFIEKNNEGIELNWVVSSARMHHYFAVERSTDGIHFDELTRIEDPIPENGNHSFRYLDQTLPPVSSLYYRIRQCDFDGSCHFSETKRISLNEIENRIRIYPMPAREKLNIQYHAQTKQTVQLRVLDPLGQVKMVKKIKVVRGINQFSIPTGGLSPSFYILQFILPKEESFTKTFLKK